MIDFHQVETAEDRRHVRELYGEYLAYMQEVLGREFGFELEVESYLEQDMAQLGKLLPPQGRLLLVESDGAIAGLGGLRQIGEHMGEIKRMYVRPAFRGRRLGRLLLDRLIAEARSIGYDTLRLDVGAHAPGAERIYRAAGFDNIDPYPQTEAPVEVHARWQFMELSLV